MYSALGRINLLSFSCSKICAHQPDIREQANKGVNKVDLDLVWEPPWD